MFPSVPAAASDCADSSGDAAIAACTGRINSGKYRGLDQAKNYYNRGYEYDAKEDFDLAISDYTSALKLVPDYRKAVFNRGLAYVHTSANTTTALWTITRRSNSIHKDPETFNNRGNAYDDKGGNYDRALGQWTMTMPSVSIRDMPRPSTTAATHMPPT